MIKLQMTDNDDEMEKDESKMMIDQMEKMEIMKQQDEASDELPATTPMTQNIKNVQSATSDDMDISDVGEDITEPSEDLETTTVIATSFSTSEAFSYYSSVSSE